MKKPHIMAAQAIKKQLKIQFPDIKFAVRTGGCGYFSRIDVFYPVSVGFDHVGTYHCSPTFSERSLQNE